MVSENNDAAWEREYRAVVVDLRLGSGYVERVWVGTTAGWRMVVASTVPSQAGRP